MQGVMQGAKVATRANALVDGLKLDCCEGVLEVLTSPRSRCIAMLGGDPKRSTTSQAPPACKPCLRQFLALGKAGQMYRAM
ncbi:Uncharacterised protein [Mycobacteroides abscessus]|nr:Uncharacterised protein [Mycobacteroides abscessus]SIG27203.1 Uncharacterised protein [Mycobacteroides abscessus subsp. abscessus]SIN46297.1 Uncharacterised protein [Mycobacteroides abscessus subsp. abscessus]SKX44607.1 Uncharacterised protein [Mycobacteroides abscessus subsp. abscessus]